MPNYQAEFVQVRSCALIAVCHECGGVSLIAVVSAYCGPRCPTARRSLCRCGHMDGALIACSLLRAAYCMSLIAVCNDCGVARADCGVRSIRRRALIAAGALIAAVRRLLRAGALIAAAVCLLAAVCADCGVR